MAHYIDYYYPAGPPAAGIRGFSIQLNTGKRLPSGELAKLCRGCGVESRKVAFKGYSLERLPWPATLDSKEYGEARQ